MDEILSEFVVESKSLINDLDDLLEEIEDDPSKYRNLETFGQAIDRVMGGAMNIAMDYPKENPIHTISSYCQICKLVGYKASQIGDNQQLTSVVTALLLDATEILQQLIAQLEKGESSNVNQTITKTFLDRLNWVATKFDENLRASVAIAATPEESQSAQADIDKLLKQLGLS